MQFPREAIHFPEEGEIWRLKEQWVKVGTQKEYYQDKTLAALVVDGIFRYLFVKISRVSNEPFYYTDSNKADLVHYNYYRVPEGSKRNMINGSNQFMSNFLKYYEPI